MCNFSGMIKNVLPSLRQRAGPQRICSRQKSIRSGTARDSFSQTPHVRGKDDEGRLKLRHVGITPAYAGKRWLWLAHFRPEKDHPRVCGEKFPSKLLSVVILGSPPRMRGKVLAGTGLCSLHGITPAYAGKRWLWLAHFRPEKDHPRVCGEKVCLRCCDPPVIGSPPRMRGKVEFLLDFTRQFRITPAYAGKRRHPAKTVCCCRDHPRMCGEKLLL